MGNFSEKGQAKGIINPCSLAAPLVRKPGPYNSAVGRFGKLGTDMRSHRHRTNATTCFQTHISSRCC